MRLRYTPEALVELDRVLSDIAEHSPQGARRVQARVRAVADLLLRRPNAGQPTGLEPMRRIIATPYPYLIFYEPHDDEIIIIGVRHGVRDPQSMPDQQPSDGETA